MVNAQSIYFGSDEITSVYYGGNLVWNKPTAEEGNWFIGVTSDGNPYNVKLNGSTISVNSGEKYIIEEPLTSTYMMFYECKALTSLDVSHFDTSKVTNMYLMFYGCKALTTVGDLSGWDTSNVTDMNYMFSNCKALTTVGDLSGWDTSKVTDMVSMFSNCNALTSLDLANWNTSNVTSMNLMFSNCNALTSLDLANWNTSNVTSMNGMFSNCNALTTVTGPITGIKLNISLAQSPLTHDSAMVFLNGLATVSSTRTITFKSTTYDTLTPEEIALATSKGWSVARS